MKKRMLPFLIMSCYFLLPAQTVTVVSPNGGESWPLGSTHAVTWNFSGIPGNTLVKLVLFKDGNKIGHIVQNISIGSSGTGSFNWKVGDYEGGTAAAGSGYKIHIRDMDGTYPLDESDASFTITALPPPPPPPTPTLTITVPDGGEKWVLKSQQTIKWTAVNIPGKVRLELVRHQGQMLGIIADNLAANAGSYVWKAGEYAGQTAPTGQYHVRVRSLANTQLADEGDNPFTLQHMQIIHEAFEQNFSKPDLIVCTETAVYVPRKTLGTFHIRVRNIGQGVAKAGFKVEIFLAGHTPFLRTYGSDLGPGATGYITDISDSKLGQTTIGLMVTVDPANEVAESNEENNRATGVLVIKDGPLPANGPVTCSDGSTL